MRGQLLDAPKADPGNKLYRKSTFPGKRVPRLNLGFGRREFARFAKGGEAVSAMGAITKRFIFSQTAAAPRNDGTTG
jgi:hypothetical protein